MSIGSPPSPPSPSTPIAGANTFSSLKSMFKPTLPTQKKCKICGEMFTPKIPGMESTKQKQAAAIAEAHKPL